MDDEEGDDYDDDHRGELDSLDPLQVGPSENQVELFIVKDCDPPSLQVLVVRGRPEKVQLIPRVTPNIIFILIMSSRSHATNHMNQSNIRLFVTLEMILYGKIF